ncbi:pentatricopeptide repeat-containing protein At2g15980 [Primulina eburnea]|uniref:pentatricopeptide repeat-containing protein At2g15980 n=1 Tax=Primulina eburnea TaxID=1245227 RepID=UPI003C6C7BA3
MAFFETASCKFVPFSSQFTKKISSCSSGSLSNSEDIVLAAVSILKHHRSKSRWSNLRSLLGGKNCRLTADQFSEIVLQLRNTPHLSLGFFNFTRNHSLCSHTLFSYSTVIHILSRSRLKSQAQALIKSSMVVFSEAHHQESSTPVALFEALIKTYRVCDSAPFVFDLLVKACIDAKKIDAAIEIYKMLRSKNLLLRTSTCNSLIELVSKGRGCFRMYYLYKDIFGLNDDEGGKGSNGKSVVPNAATFNAVMVGFYREGLLEKVMEVWQEMESCGCVPNAYGYSMLMVVYSEYGNMEDAMKVRKEMENKCIKCDAVVYNTIIGGYCRIGEVGKAEEIYREMVTNGTESTCTTFEHLINGYCKTGDADSAMLLYKDMCRKGFIPENLTVNGIVRTLCDKDRVSTAMTFLRLLGNKHGVVLEDENHVRLIKATCQAGMMDEALRLQAEMAVKGFEPDSEIYGAFIDGYKKIGNDTMACKLRNEMLGQQTS